MTTAFIHSFDSPVGTIRLASTESGLVAVGLPGQKHSDFQSTVQKLLGACTLTPGGKLNQDAERQILSFLDGKTRTFDLPLDLRVSPYSRKVLGTVAGIPFGKTKTYKQIASQLGNPGAARAVGSANARNPLPLVIPCHRVVAGNGLGGYGGGLKLKQRLLELEGAD